MPSVRAFADGGLFFGLFRPLALWYDVKKMGTGNAQ